MPNECEHGCEVPRGANRRKPEKTKTRQRVRVPVDSALVAEAEEAVARAWDLATYGDIPPPLVDSPKCPGCSLNTICLPDETNRLTEIDLSGAAQLGLFDGSEDAPVRKPPASEGIQTQIRQLMTPRDGSARSVR